MILVAFVGSARAWRLVWREQLVWLSALLEQNVKLVEANYKLQKLPGPNGVVYMSE